MNCTVRTRLSVFRAFLNEAINFDRLLRGAGSDLGLIEFNDPDLGRTLTLVKIDDCSVVAHLSATPSHDEHGDIWVIKTAFGLSPRDSLLLFAVALEVFGRVQASSNISPAAKKLLDRLHGELLNNATGVVSGEDSTTAVFNKIARGKYANQLRLRGRVAKKNAGVSSAQIADEGEAVFTDVYHRSTKTGFDRYFDARSPELDNALRSNDVVKLKKMLSDLEVTYLEKAESQWARDWLITNEEALRKIIEPMVNSPDFSPENMAAESIGSILDFVKERT